MKIRKRLPFYAMTAAIAMSGASAITAQAAVKVTTIGNSSKICDRSWKQTAGNCFRGIKLPDCGILKPNDNQPVYPDQNGSGQPDIIVPDVVTPEVPDNAEADSFTAQVVKLVNEERAKAGLSPLIVDSKVAGAASTRAREIETSFSHTRPDQSSFSTALTQNGVSFQSAGENIAYGQQTPKAVMNSWMNSQGHRANILNKDFTTIGVGYHQSSNGTGYWTQLFTR